MERFTDEYEVDLKKCIESGCEESCWWACLYIFDAIKNFQNMKIWVIHQKNSNKD